jgi:hypothetical protein
MKRIILLGIGAVCIPSLVLFGCNDRSGAIRYDGGMTSTQPSSADPDSGSKQSPGASAATEMNAGGGAGAWEGGLSIRR